MKKSLSKKQLDEIRKSRASYFPDRPEEMNEEDRALEMLLIGLRIIQRGKENSVPMPLMLYGPAMEFYFKWIAK